MMKKQIHIFFAALMFYTRLPCPKWATHDPHYLNRATVYFPLIGWIVGLLAFLGFWLASLLFSPMIAVIFSMVVSIFTTGAFHEDGFADTCDGFGGGWTKEKILTIMKDSRIGTYGATGLLFILGLKAVSLYEIAWWMDLPGMLFSFITAHSVSRSAAATTLYTHVYCRENDDSKAKPLATKMSLSDLLIVIGLGIIPLILFSIITSKYFLLLIPIPVYLIKMAMAKYFKKWIGGYTGDCLGAIQQVTEVVVYLCLLIIWKYT